MPKSQMRLPCVAMVFTLTNHRDRTIVYRYGFNCLLPIDPLSCEGTGSSIEIRIPILGTRFNPIFHFTGVIFSPFQS